MRRLLILFVIFAAPAMAQETYSLSANANQVADLTQIISGINVDTCVRLGQAPSCTQSQACVADNTAGGSSCTAAQARAAGVRIWPTTQAGREEFVSFFIALPAFRNLKSTEVGRMNRYYCQVIWPAMNQTQKDAECSTVGRPAGCDRCGL